MNREQRFRYEMFVRVHDFGTANKDLFPEGSKGSQMFTRVTAAVAAVDEHLKDHFLGRAEARKVKAATRVAVFDYMKTLALAARRVTAPESGQSPFRIPRGRSYQGDLTAARGFIEEATKRQDEFVQFGLPATFVADFRTLVDKLQEAVDVRLSSKTVRRVAQAGVVTALAEGFDAVRNLDVVMAIATRHDPTRAAAYRSARRVEGQRGAPSKPLAPAKPSDTPVLAPVDPLAKAS